MTGAINSTQLLPGSSPMTGAMNSTKLPPASSPMTGALTSTQLPPASSPLTTLSTMTPSTTVTSATTTVTSVTTTVVTSATPSPNKTSPTTTSSTSVYNLVSGNTTGSTSPQHQTNTTTLPSATNLSLSTMSTLSGAWFTTLSSTAVILVPGSVRNLTFTNRGVTNTSLEVTWLSALGAVEKYTVLIAPIDSPSISINYNGSLTAKFAGLRPRVQYIVTVKTIGKGNVSDEGVSVTQSTGRYPHDCVIVEDETFNSDVPMPTHGEST
uniref:GPI-anchored protein pfl2 n=1 Tax=Petromyzon marinus TaxID=7757 RepID=A0AAJ7TI15_PETMA|nr:putative GPI-anchored protein pfl2 [Petromyzon marinus]